MEVNRGVTKFLLAACIALCRFSVTTVEALDNGLALTPPMGWMSWERYRCITDCKRYPDECISERLFKRMADLLVSEGYRDAGYEYVNIDDCWMAEERDEDGILQPDKERFPNGIKHLADYIHDRGLKFGIYQDIGTKTCAGYPGMVGYFKLDAQTFADWGVDFIKIDGCYADVELMVEDYIRFGRYMNETGRPILYSCSWPAYQEYDGIIPDYEQLKETCNMWRNWGDIEDSHQSVVEITKYFSDHQNRIIPHSGPTHWNDPDTLILGNYGLSYDQSKSQLAVWTVLAAPLLISNDLSKVTPEVKDLLLNPEIIAANQDRLGIQGRLVKKVDKIEIWKRPILPKIGSELTQVVAFVSRRADGAPYAVKVDLRTDVGLNSTIVRAYKVYDLFETKGKPSYVRVKDHFETRINPTGANLYRFVPIVSTDFIRY
ncbi:alpha-N-acetylgalactosaminidase [Anopheles darlingi]|uniref:alpha-N-acetylgalactosaminidase n=1 Tax=Anopheles darlingi TaxID=43151 RepID=UPI0021004E77|nr:alpha-N-acetylgalactosaminidase [Anopheles darlingi]